MSFQSRIDSEQSKIYEQKSFALVIQIFMIRNTIVWRHSVCEQDHELIDHHYDHQDF